MLVTLGVKGFIQVHKFLIFDFWFLIFDFWFLIFDFWFLIFGF